MATAGTLAVNLIARTSVFDRKVSTSRKKFRSFTGDLARSQRTMANFARGIVLAAGASGVGFFINQMVKAASAAEETQAKFDTVFRELSTSANAWAVSFGGSVGRANQDVKKWMAGLQDTFVPLGIARKEAMGLAQSLVTLAVDVASFNNAADETVIRDFTSALVGNHETVRKYGIIISESALKQAAFNAGIKKTFAQLTDLEKVQLRYALIQRGTTDAQGDAIRTAASYANQVKRLRANIDNLKVAMGSEILPVFNTVVTQINIDLAQTGEVAKKTGGSMVTAFEKIALAGAFFLNGIDAMNSGLHQFSSGILAVASTSVGAFAQIAKSLDAVQNAFARSFLGKKLGGGFARISTEGQDMAAWAEALAQESRTLAATAEAKLIDQTPLEKTKRFFMELRAQSRRQAEAQPADPAISEPGGGQAITEVGKSAADSVTALEKVKEVIASIRSQDFLTRTERIMALREYATVNAKTLAEVGTAQAALNAEILSLDKSRVNQLQVYFTELREDMQNTELFIAEKMATAAKSVENSMGRAFTSMAMDGMSFRDAMVSFARDIQRAFMQIAADILARQIMGMAIGALFGPPIPAGGDVNPAMASIAHSGGIVGRTSFPQRAVNPAIFANAPRMHNGGIVGADEFPIIARRGERILPAGMGGGGGGLKVTVIMKNETGRELEATQGETFFDGQSYIVETVVNDFHSNGPIRNLFGSQ